MRRNCFWLSFGLLLAIALPFNASRAIAHQELIFGNIRATVHLDPQDSPHARVPSFTWFHLKRPDGGSIPLSDCNCSLVVYNDQNQVMVQPQLAETEVAGHERPITTRITFPDPGSYRLIFTGRSRTNSFDPFQLSISVIVRP